LLTDQLTLYLLMVQHYLIMKSGSFHYLMTWIHVTSYNIAHLHLWFWKKLYAFCVFLCLPVQSIITILIPVLSVIVLWGCKTVYI